MKNLTATKHVIKFYGVFVQALCTNSAPAGRTKLTDWARELARRKNREVAYGKL